MPASVGTVKYFNTNKGCGFITPDGADAGDLFVHITNCADHIDDLRQGQRVRFDVQQSRRKEGQLEAIAVEVV